MFQIRKCKPIRAEFRVKNLFGLHVRPATKICEIATFYPETSVKLAQQGSTSNFIDAKNILGILTIAAPKDTIYTIEACGPQAAEVISEIKRSAENMFGCDE